MKVRIFVKEIVPPCWFDTNLPEGSDFRHVANEIMLNGFSSKDMVIAASNIAAIFVVPMEQDLPSGVIVSQGPVGKQ